MLRGTTLRAIRGGSRAFSSTAIRAVGSSGSSGTGGSSGRPLREYLVIAHDFQDSGCLERRQKTRPAHLDVVHEGVKKGTFLWGGAMLEQTTDTPKGSVVLMLGESIDQVRQRIKDDPYVLGKVWDESRITVVPFKTAVSAMTRTQ